MSGIAVRITGRRACPPEDCGGVWGYASLLEALADPRHEDHEDTLEWFGEEYDAGAFGPAVVNARLERFPLRLPNG